MSDHFAIPDSLVAHLRTVVPTLGDPILEQKYTGLVCVIAVTSYELSLKEIFIAFGQKKHKVFGSFVASYFDQINGRIKLANIRKDYLPRFGKRYELRFESNLRISRRKH